MDAFPPLGRLESAIRLAAEYRSLALAERFPDRSAFLAGEAAELRDAAATIAAGLVPGATFDGVELLVPIQLRGRFGSSLCAVTLDQFAELAQRSMSGVCVNSALSSPAASCDGGRP